MSNSFNRYLHFVHIREKLLVHPAKEIRMEIRSTVEAHLRTRFQTGTYDRPEDCNAIFNYLFEFHEASLNRLLPNILTADWIGLIIFQHEESGEISSDYKQNKLTEEEAAYWRENGAHFRQTLDYLLEKIAALKEIDIVETNAELQAADFERILVYAEKCVGFSSISNLTYMMIPDATRAIIYPAGELRFLEHTINPIIRAQLDAQLIQNNYEVSVRNQYLKQNESPFNFAYQCSMLDEPFRQTFGVSYEQFQKIIAVVGLAAIQPITEPRKAPMMFKDDFYHKAIALSVLPAGAVRIILDNLILDVEKPRQIWDARQPNRINRQPFLQFKSRDRIVIMWSPKKVVEYITQVESELMFKRTPAFWDSPDIRKAIETISNHTGRWFEKCVIPQLARLGFIGRELGIQAFRSYPGVTLDCGQIDYLGFHPSSSCLVLLEFKMIETGFEARGARQVRDKFLSGDRAYVPTLKRKIKWVKDNLQTVRQLFEREYKISLASDTTCLCTSFITFYPTLLKISYKEIPCVSLVQFIEDWTAMKQWPYAEGKFEIPL